MTEPAWNTKLAADRRAFMALLAPLAFAARCHDFDEPRNESDRREVQMRLTTWMQPFVHVPRDVVSEAFARVLERGVGWMPRADELKAVCADIVSERRRRAKQRADELVAACLICPRDGWRRVEVAGQQATVRRCECWTRGQALIAEAGQPIERPALPAAPDDGAAA